MALRLLSLTQRFGEQTALDDVSIHVREGDCYGFLGHNGAGKTTAMRIALGLMRPDEGRVLVDGFDAARYPREARARMGGLIEVPGFHDGAPGPANLEVLAGLQGLGRAEAVAEAARLMGVVGLEHAGAKPVRAYSHGMRQRLGIAQALLGRPRYVLLDEPTNGLDPEGIADMRGLLRRLTAEEGVTILLSSHQLHEIGDLCTRIGILKQGRLLLEAETRELMQSGASRYRLEAAPAPRVREVLDGLGVAWQPEGTPGAESGGDSLRLELGPRPPPEVTRELVEAGCELLAFTPRPQTLEEIYLHASEGVRGEGRPAPGGERTAAAGEPDPLLAPAWPTLRTVQHEFRRWRAQASGIWLLLLPAVLAVTAVIRRRAQALPDLEQVESAELISTTAVTAFEGTGRALQAGLPLAAMVLVGLASQSIAGEFARGTLRNVLLRPVRRLQLVAGKAAACLALALISYLLLVGASVAAAAWAFDFGDVAEILPNGAAFVLVPASELWPELWRALLAPLLPLCSYVALGFLAGTLVRSSAAALALALGGAVLLDVARALARAFRVEGWLPSAYLPSPLGDTSELQYFADVSQGVSNASFAYQDTALVVPLAWTLLAWGLAALVLARRPIP